MKKQVRFYSFFKYVNMILFYCKLYYFVAFKLLYNKREIRGLAYYSLDQINGGYNLKYEGRLWLDAKKDPNSESTLSINNYFTIQDGLSAGSAIKIYVPLFNDKVT